MSALTDGSSTRQQFPQSLKHVLLVATVVALVAGLGVVLSLTVFKLSYQDANDWLDLGLIFIVFFALVFGIRRAQDSLHYDIHIVELMSVMEALLRGGVDFSGSCRLSSPGVTHVRGWKRMRNSRLSSGTLRPEIR